MYEKMMAIPVNSKIILLICKLLVVVIQYRFVFRINRINFLMVYFCATQLYELLSAVMCIKKLI